MANTICWASSDEADAATLNNAPGSAVNVLDAFLKDGFHPRVLTSVVVSGGVATCTLNGHGYSDGRMLDIGGSSPTALNGRQKITVISANAFTFPAVGVSDGAASGTITAKRSPLGWTKSYSGTDKAVYARSDPAATAALLRVDDTGSGVAAATYARMVAYESMTDIDTGVGPAPTAVALSGGQYLQKGANTGAAKPWVMVGDSRTFFLLTDTASYPYSSYGALDLHGFGDFNSFRAGDPYACFIVGGGVDNAGSDTFLQVTGGGSSLFNNSFLAMRAANAVGGAISLQHIGPSLTTSSLFSYMGNAGPAYPSGVDNGMVQQYPLLMQEYTPGSGYPIRGTMRGIAHPMASIGSRLHMQILPNVGGTGRDFLAVAVKFRGTVGCVLFDITGPW